MSWAAAQPETPAKEHETDEAAATHANAVDEVEAKAAEDGKASTDAAAKAVAAATKAATEASSAAKAVTSALEEAKFADLKGGKFIQYGITAGVAFAIQSKAIAEGTAGARQKSLAATTMPYVLLVPAYWALGDITATYCATAFGSNVALARDAAVSYARKRAAAALEPLSRQVYDAGPGGTKTDADRRDYSAIAELVDDRAFGKKVAGSSVRGDTDSNGNDRYWDLKRDGACGWSKLGFFVGKPLSYDASVQTGESAGQAKAQVDSFFSFGIAYVPNAYVTLLGGFSVNSVTVPGTTAISTEPATPDTLRRFVTLVFGLGGNIDVISQLFQ